jgi:ATP adenylyltransferase
VDVLWSPWRYDYIKGSETKKNLVNDCVFCTILKDSATDEEKYILHRAEFNFVILNIFPYTTGHLMVVPFAHISEIAQADKKTTDEMMDLTKRAQAALGAEYSPDGFNVGMNLGRAAGAGVANHFHMHVLPRWIGDVNFMTSVGETRTMPEELSSTFQKLKSRF